MYTEKIWLLSPRTRRSLTPPHPSPGAVFISEPRQNNYSLSSKINNIFHRVEEQPSPPYSPEKCFCYQSPLTQYSACGPLFSRPTKAQIPPLRSIFKPPKCRQRSTPDKEWRCARTVGPSRWTLPSSEALTQQFERSGFRVSRFKMCNPCAGNARNLRQPRLKGEDFGKMYGATYHEE